MRALGRWFNARTGLGDWCCRLAETRMPGGACWCKVMPCAIVFAFCVQAITGFFLWAYYSPSAQTAWESVYFLQSQVAGGWFLRAMHHYSAHVLLAMLMVQVVQSIITGADRVPRELVFWATVGLGLCAAAAVLTGDLLSWDQNGYAATKTRTGFLAFLPLVGPSLLKIAIGGPGPALGSLAITRFFALHVGVFAASFGLLLVVREVLARRADAAELAATGAGTPWWPAHAWRGAVAGLLMLLVVLLLACQHGVTPPEAGVPLLSPADTDPAGLYKAARPEWFLVGVFEFRNLFSSPLVPVFIVPALVLCIVLAMPFLATRTIGQVFNVAFTAGLLIALVAMSWYSLAKDRADEAHQKAIAIESWQAERVRELARREGIPPTGALSLLRGDPKAEGRRLFTQYCASCHNHGTSDGSIAVGEDIWLDPSTAPNLSGFASRGYLKGLLDPKRIVGPEYFGNTKLRRSKMVSWVKDNLADLDAAEKRDLEKAIMAVSAEAKLPAQQDADAKDAKSIEEGRAFILNSVSLFTCTDCHKFHDKGTQGDAPNLTGYGSPEWIAGAIRNPASPRFYGKLNDRMPAYAASADPAQNTVSDDQIKLLTAWLRGEWYEERRDEQN